MFPFSRKAPFRRAAIRESRPDSPSRRWEEWRNAGIPTSIGIAVLFWVIASTILMLRQDVVRYRPGQYTTHDVVSRVDFKYFDKDRLATARRSARELQPRIYKQTTPDSLQTLQATLLALPDRASVATTASELPGDIREILDDTSLTRLKQYTTGSASRQNYEKMIHSYIDALRASEPGRPGSGLVVLPNAERQKDLSEESVILLSADGTQSEHVRPALTYSLEMTGDLEKRLLQPAKQIDAALAPKIIALTLQTLKPTHVFDEAATTELQNRAEAEVPRGAGNVNFGKNQTLIAADTEVDDEGWQLLRAENDAYVTTVEGGIYKYRAGIGGTVAILTVLLAVYVAKFQPRVVRNHARGAAIVALLLSMLLLAQLAGIGSSPLYVFAVAPTILVAMILAIAYDARFATGVGMIHAMLVTLSIGESFSFFVILLAGVMTCCFLLSDIRTRSRLIEVGGATALAMMLATAAAGAIRLDPIAYIGKNALYTGAAGLAVGFIVLGILPFIEKAFRITTSMTLLELADASHPLLRRLHLEAPGTYNHSLQVAAIAEAAAEAIGVNSLLCRVGAYYHDVGKINKAEYFIENQVNGENRHINLSPNVSLLIIIGHVKDGLEMAKEYNLPTSLFPFIQQHHGTTLVEYFYHQACTKLQQPDGPSIAEAQFRYPGPKPRSKEVAIVMMSDAIESAARTMTDPSPARIEALVHDLTLKRLLDGQFDECDLSMREIDIIERTCVKTMMSIYHGRIAYPSTAAVATGMIPQQAARTA